MYSRLLNIKKNLGIKSKVKIDCTLKLSLLEKHNVA